MSKRYEALEALAIRFETTRPSLTDKEIAAELRSILCAPDETPRDATFAIPDTVQRRVDKVLQDARVKIDEYLALEKRNAIPLDQNQIYRGAAETPKYPVELRCAELEDLLGRVAEAFDVEHESYVQVTGGKHRETCKTCDLIVEAKEAIWRPTPAKGGA
jgi:hypothetical protein